MKERVFCGDCGHDLANGVAAVRAALTGEEET